VILAITERVRFRRGAPAGWDMLAVGFAAWFGLLAVIGWACLAIGAIR